MTDFDAAGKDNLLIDDGLTNRDLDVVDVSTCTHVVQTVCFHNIFQ